MGVLKCAQFRAVHRTVTPGPTARANRVRAQTEHQGGERAAEKEVSIGSTLPPGMSPTASSPAAAAWSKFPAPFKNSPADVHSHRRITQKTRIASCQAPSALIVVSCTRDCAEQHFGEISAVAPTSDSVATCSSFYLLLDGGNRTPSWSI